MLVLKLRGAHQRMCAKAGRYEDATPFGMKPGEEAVVERISNMREVGNHLGRGQPIASRAVTIMLRMAASICRIQWMLVMTVALSLYGEQAPPQLLGRWRSVETSRGGIGSMFTFHSDGVVDFSPGAVVEMTYRIEDNELVLPPATTGGAEQRQKFEFTRKNQLRLSEVLLTRQGAVPDANNLLLGEWLGTREMNGRPLEMRYLFYPAGKCLFLLQFTTSHGRYSIRGSTMRLDLPGHHVAEGKFQIEGDKLTLPGPSGSQDRFRRY